MARWQLFNDKRHKGANLSLKSFKVIDSSSSSNSYLITVISSVVKPLRDVLILPRNRLESPIVFAFAEHFSDPDLNLRGKQNNLKKRLALLSRR